MPPAGRAPRPRHGPDLRSGSPDGGALPCWRSTGSPAFTAYTRKWLGVATETKSAQSDLVERLESRLRANGISPTDAGDLEEEYRLLAKARESALEAVRVYNDPSASYLACMRTLYLGFLPHIEAHNCGSLKSTY